MRRYRENNWVFLITIITVMFAGFIPFGAYVRNFGLLLVISQLIIALPSIIYLYVTRQNVREKIGFRKVSLVNILLLALFAYCLSPVMTFINALSRLFVKDVITNTMASVAQENSFLVSLFFIAVIPAVFEEGVYRGIFYQEYRKVNPLKAILLSALLFGLMHGNLNQFSYAFCMGLIFALVIEATDSILSAMVIHFLINGFSVVLLYVLPLLSENYEQLLSSADETLTMDISYVLITYGIRALIFGVVGFFILKRIAQNCNRWEYMKQLFTRKKAEGKVSKESLVTTPLIIAIGICIVNIIAQEFL